MGLANATDYEISAVVVMLYPAYGPSKTKKTPIKTIFSDSLGDEGMEIFKKVFDNNNKQMIKKFFENWFVRTLWNLLLKHFSYKNCFEKKGPVKEILQTYKEITKTVDETYHLRMPQWWE